MPMWHDAWPNKDYKALAALVPAIDTHVAAISKAELPGHPAREGGRLEDRRGDALGVSRRLQGRGGSGNNEALLKAAEKLHKDYEDLGKVIRPILKEMDDFHGVLYMLYHYQLSPFQAAKIAESVQALKVKMDALNKAVLPERLKAKAEAFAAQRAALVEVGRRPCRPPRQQGRGEDQGRHRGHARRVREPREGLPVATAPNAPCRHPSHAWPGFRPVPGHPAPECRWTGHPRPRGATTGGPCAKLLTSRQLAVSVADPVTFPRLHARCTPLHRASALLSS